MVPLPAGTVRSGARLADAELETGLHRRELDRKTARGQSFAVARSPETELVRPVSR